MTRDDDPDSQDLAQDRTDLAEDRTLLANERTFAGWARTSFATIGLGLGFKALFGAFEPTWLPKAIATGFILIGVIVIIMAERRASKVVGRLTAHEIQTLPTMNLRIIAIGFVAAALTLIAAIWLFM